MKSLLKNIASTGFSIVLAGVFLYVAFRGKDINELWHSLVDVHWSWFILLFSGSAASHLIRAWRWKYLLAPIKNDVSLRNAFSVTMIGYLINNVVPRLGEFVRPFALKKLEGISKSATMGTIVLERLLDLVSFALVVLTVLAVYNDHFAIWFPSVAQFEWVFVAAAVALMALFVFIFLKADIFFTFFKKALFIFPKSIRSQSERIFDSFLSGFQASQHPGNFLMIAFSSLLIWLSYIVLLYIPFYIYNFPTDNALDFGAAAVLQVASGIAFALPTPSGIGSYHALTSFTLTDLYHVDPEKALSFAVYTHAVGFLTTTILGLFYFLADKIHVADIRRNEETEETAP